MVPSIFTELLALNVVLSARLSMSALFPSQAPSSSITLFDVLVAVIIANGLSVSVTYIFRVIVFISDQPSRFTLSLTSYVPDCLY